MPSKLQKSQRKSTLVFSLLFTFFILRMLANVAYSPSTSTLTDKTFVSQDPSQNLNPTLPQSKSSTEGLSQDLDQNKPTQNRIPPLPSKPYPPYKPPKSSTLLLKPHSPPLNPPTRTTPEHPKRLTVILAGFQKSGSSALSTYLSNHPDVSVSTGKEVHYFDRLGKAPVREMFPSIYDRNFKVKNGGGDGGSVNADAKSTSRKKISFVSEGVRFESTPFYIASATTCGYIDTLLSPTLQGSATDQNKNKNIIEDDYRMLLILRDPTDRAYSEFQMEKRRIADDDLMKTTLNTHATDFFICYAKHLLYGGGDDVAAGRSGEQPVMGVKGLAGNAKALADFAACVPEKLRGSPRFNKLKIAVYNAALKVAWDGHSNSNDNSARVQGDSVVTRWKMEVRANNDHDSNNTKAKGDGERKSLFRFTMREKIIDCISLSQTNSDYKSKLSKALKEMDNELFPNNGKGEGKDKDTPKAYSMTTTALSSYIDDKLSPFFTTDSSDNSSVGFNSNVSSTCLGMRFFEQVAPIEKVFLDEITEWKACFATHGITQNKRKFIIKRKQGNKEEEEESGIITVTRAARRCLPSPSRGITKQFIYRSLYAIQLQHCINSGVPPEKILVIDSETFKKEPRKVMKSVHAFIGVSDYQGYDLEGDGKIEEALNKQFPHFQRLSGWTVAGEYESLSLSMRGEMEEFFGAYNELLADMVGPDVLSFWK